MVSVGLASARLGGLTAAACSVALCLSSGVFLSTMAGGNPRAFGFPWLAAGAAALAWGRTWWLAMTVVGAAAFYQPVAIVLGTTLALHLLILPARARGDSESWPFRRRMLLLAATVLCALLVLAPGLMARGYGPLLTADDVAAYPEAGGGGRYDDRDRIVAPFPSLWSELLRTQHETLTGGAPPWSERLRAVAGRAGFRGELAVVCAMVVGFALVAKKEPAARRLALLGLAVLTVYAASRLAAPYLYAPQRYLGYPIPVLIVIALPVAAGAVPLLSRYLAERRWSRPVAKLAITGACLLFFGGPGDDRAGLTVDHRSDWQVFKFLRTLPETSLLAGWPGFREPIDSVPYLARRRAFVTFETHQAFHRGYVDTMRGRMRAVIDAMFATDPAPLLRLRDNWGVTHLIIDRRHFDATPPKYSSHSTTWSRKRSGRVA